jgi:hypothetical protein
MYQADGTVEHSAQLINQRSEKCVLRLQLLEQVRSARAVVQFGLERDEHRARLGDEYDHVWGVLADRGRIEPLGCGADGRLAEAVLGEEENGAVVWVGTNDQLAGGEESCQQVEMSEVLGADDRR